MNVHDRPRERLAEFGPAALGDNELLAVVLGSGIRHMDVLAIANEILEQVGGVHALARTGHDTLRRLKGVGGARAAQVVAALELGRRALMRRLPERVQLRSPREVGNYLLPRYGSRTTEHFGIVMLDTKHRVLRTSVISVGTLDSTIVRPREVFREAALADATSVVLFHNHPSGDPMPSADDVDLTNRMMEAGELMGIAVLDHIVLGDNHFCSLRESGRI